MVCIRRSNGHTSRCNIERYGLRSKFRRVTRYAFHSNYRTSLRSSSIDEPRYPSLKVVLLVVVVSPERGSRRIVKTKFYFVGRTNSPIARSTTTSRRRKTTSLTDRRPLRLFPRRAVRRRRGSHVPQRRRASKAPQFVRSSGLPSPVDIRCFLYTAARSFCLLLPSEEERRRQFLERWDEPG